MRYILTMLAALACALPAHAEVARSSAAKRAFAREHPCPATGRQVPSCPGFVIDHRHSLCAGGSDTPDNMVWQTVEDSKRKDRVERQYCAWLRKLAR